AERVGSHGGSLRATVQLAGGPRRAAASLGERIDEERALGLDRADTLKGFGAKIDTIKRQLTGCLKDLKAEGLSIAGFGAPAKATTLMYHFGIGPEFIDFIVDDSPLKQGLYSPGMHIPVLPSSALYDKKPGAVVVLAWNFADAIIANHAAYREAGGRFIVPLPEVTLR
ncbi:MAG: methyltransferase C-terminal domain-containing protein, partial [Rhodospirillaceae bacterium]